MEKGERSLRLGISTVDGIGPRNFQHILEEYGSITSLVNASPERIFASLGQKVTTEILRWRDEYDTYKLPQKLEDLGINFVVFGEENYPELLKEIYDPPTVIYYIGNYDKELISKSISVVGTRKMSSLGREVTERISAGLANEGLGIVSGMAYGVDKTAHETAINNHGYTVAVLGGPVNEPSPIGNTYLYRKITKSGLVISECQPGTLIEKWSFPRRNRIISALTKATLVTEAPIRSGALISAYLALEQNREVFAVPWSLSHVNGAGCNRLIRNSNAKLITSVEEILEDLGLWKDKSEGYKQSHQKINLKLSKLENEIVYVLGSGECGLDSLLDRLEYSVSIVTSAISELEIKGIVARGDDGKIRLTYR